MAWCYKNICLSKKSFEEKVLSRVKAPLVLHLALLWIQSPSGRIPKLWFHWNEWCSSCDPMDIQYHVPWRFLQQIPALLSKPRKQWWSVLILRLSPPTYDRNWQWEADPHNFQEETKLYNGIRAADLSGLFSPLKIKQQTKRNIAKLTQSILLRGHHNRIYHHSS